MLNERTSLGRSHVGDLLASQPLSSCEQPSGEPAPKLVIDKSRPAPALGPRRPPTPTRCADRELCLSGAPALGAQESADAGLVDAAVPSRVGALFPQCWLARGSGSVLPFPFLAHFSPRGGRSGALPSFRSCPWRNQSVSASFRSEYAVSSREKIHFLKL